MANVEECISERECKLYDEGLSTKVKLVLQARRYKVGYICLG